MATVRDTWSVDEIVDVQGAELVVRTYIEQSELRRYLTRVAARRPLSRVSDIGAGYGRMSQVMKEFCDSVVAFERESELVSLGSFLLPSVQYRQIHSLERLPAREGEFDFALSFTVLQHLSDELARAAIAELRRVIGPGGYALLCEETDDSERRERPANPHADYNGRTLEVYKEWMSPFELVETSPRLIERGYKRKDVGQYMLFLAPSGQPAEG
jgi:SAM-dependent methyltransferase